jgi:serine/threonine protein kinase
MRLDEISDPRFERYFLRREIEIVQKLNHPNIAKVLTVFEADQSIMLIGELYQCDLLQYIQQRGVIGERVARRLIKELCGAVHFLHSNDVGKI